MSIRDGNTSSELEGLSGHDEVTGTIGLPTVILTKKENHRNDMSDMKYD